MENGPVDTYTSPSFNCYCSQRLAEIAGEAAGENQETDGDEFEFALAREGNDEFFCGGRIGPVFPVFCRDLLLSCDDESSMGSGVECVMKVPLSRLLEETRRDENDRYPASCSSSEADELVPFPSRCKKSKSTGSASRRWKLPEFLRRSNSEGRDPPVFMTPKRDKTAETSRKSVDKAPPPSAHEALYVQNRAKKENARKKSYLPYRPDLVGLFATANSSGKSSPR